LPWPYTASKSVPPQTTGVENERYSAIFFSRLLVT
jgi:hypothetical protein